MYKVLVTDSLDNVYHSPRWKVGDDNDCLKVWWPWSDHVILITCHHQLSLSLYKFVVSHITVQSVLKHRSPGDFMKLRPGVERGNRTSYSFIMRIVLYCPLSDNDKNSKNVQIKSPLKKNICFKNSSYNSLTERQGDYLSSGFFYMHICRRSCKTAQIKWLCKE